MCENNEKITLKYSEIIKNQPITNIGCVGHVSHGKSMVVRKITGIQTQKYKKELERNITINLGYANAKIFRSSTGKLFTNSSDTDEMFDPDTNEKLKLIKHVSFVDNPGHHAFMATMITGCAVIDMAFLLIAANENIVPQPQTAEHMAVLARAHIDNILILQNKLDLVTRDECIENLKKIKNYVTNTPAKNSTILPISAQREYNIDAILNYIVNNDNNNELQQKINKPMSMVIIRSFDINKPNSNITDLKGSVIGGTIMQGVVGIGDIIELRPGLYSKKRVDDKMVIVCKPLLAKVESLYSDKRKIEKYAIPGGLIGVGLSIDSVLAKSDGLVGQLAGKPGTLPKIYKQII